MDVPGKRESCGQSPRWRLIVRLVVDITKTRDGRYEGRLTVPGTGAQSDFAGILELMAILEDLLGPEDARHAGRETDTDPDPGPIG
jgi:hypothetical protein